MRGMHPVTCDLSAYDEVDKFSKDRHKTLKRIG